MKTQPAIKLCGLGKKSSFPHLERTASTPTLTCLAARLALSCCVPQHSRTVQNWDLGSLLLGSEPTWSWEDCPHPAETSCAEKLCTVMCRAELRPCPSWFCGTGVGGQGATQRWDFQTVSPRKASA